MNMKKKVSFYSEANLVESVYKHNSKMERKLYDYCKQYFDNHYHSMFFIGEGHKNEIFQEAFITLWEHIENRRIYAEEGVLYGRKGEMFYGSLTTYLMSIAKLKYLEWSRSTKKINVSDKEKESGMKKWDWEQFQEQIYNNDDESQLKLDLISDCINKMSPQCNKILTMFYYEEKSLDNIMAELPTFVSKDALKTAKYKCMERLRASFKHIYYTYMNK